MLQLPARHTSAHISAPMITPMPAETSTQMLQPDLHTCLHTYPSTNVPRHMSGKQIRIHINTQVSPHGFAHVYIQVYTNVFPHAYTHIYEQDYTHICPQAFTQFYTHARKLPTGLLHKSSHVYLHMSTRMCLCTVSCTDDMTDICKGVCKHVHTHMAIHMVRHLPDWQSQSED